MLIRRPDGGPCRWYIAFIDRYLPAISDQIRIEPVRQTDFEALLPLIEGYQRFYEVAEIDRDHNREYFKRFLAPSEVGLLIGAWEGETMVGYTCLHWSQDSVAARELVTLYDLYVDDGQRGCGIGRKLINAAADVARDRGAAAVVWETAPDNHRAQRLYDSLDTERSEWISYELRV